MSGIVPPELSQGEALHSTEIVLTLVLVKEAIQQREVFGSSIYLANWIVPAEISSLILLMPHPYQEVVANGLPEVEVQPNVAAAHT